MNYEYSRVFECSLDFWIHAGTLIKESGDNAFAPEEE